MRKLKFKLHKDPATLYWGILLVLLFVGYSCSSSRNSSVREIKDSRKSRIDKPSKSEAMVKPLFMQYERVTAELPDDGVFEFDEGSTLSEIVTYSNKTKKEVVRNKLDTTLTYDLDEFVIVAKSTYTPERDGRVMVNFDIKVPKEYISPDWSLTLTPMLLHNDSLVELEDVILKGENFHTKQKQDYQAYDDYVNSIVDKSQYDSVFSDKKNISKDIKNRQEFYWKLYNDEWNKHKNFEKWKTKAEDQEAYKAARKLGQRENLRNEYTRKAREKSIQEFAKGKDTTGIYAEHMRQFEKKAKNLPDEWEKKELKSVPSQYKAIFEGDKDIEDLSNFTMTEKDSIEIAQNRYMFDKIAENELKAERLDEKREELIPFPFRENVRLDSVVHTRGDMVYHYSQDYPVTEGLKSIGISLRGYVQAIDHSTYTLPETDTIRYYISSLAQLADTSLMYKNTTIYRNMFDKITIYPKFAAGKYKFDINYGDNKQQVDSLVNKYHSLSSKYEGAVVDSVTIHTTTSLDGAFDANALYTQERGESLKNYLAMTYGNRIDVANTFATTFKGEDWQTMVNLMRKRNDLPNKQEIFDIVTQNPYPDEAEESIKKQYPSDYKVMYDSIYPKLRKMEITYHMSRPGMATSDSIHSEEKEGYEEGVRLLLDREYTKAFDILVNYPDYNTALCLACAGYDERAYDLLVQLKATGNTEYLLAIVCQRMGNEEDAIEHLQKAFELDPNKKHRAKLDSEIKTLVSKYNISLAE